MTRSRSHPIVLVRHPATPSRIPHEVHAGARRIPGAALALSYALHGDLGRLRLPATATPHRADRLWEHTCFEAFVGVPGKPEYYEFNFSPSRAWAVYAFRAYRDGAPLGSAVAPQIDVRQAGDRLELDALLDLGGLKNIASPAPWRLALSAVIEDEHGARTYWALKHSPGNPDFHHPDAFAFKLESEA
jgi:hypothetical protein